MTTDFDTILREWNRDTSSTLKHLEMTDIEVLDEFCFFCVEHKEARGRNSAYNEGHLIRLFGELKRRQLFPE